MSHHTTSGAAPFPVLAVLGPTGTGKSAFALRIAHWLTSLGHQPEVINADAMQLYRGMDIGTAKLTVDERSGVPHHLFDVLEVTDEASVAKYQSDARSVIEDIEARGSVPIMVGGSGLYLQAVLDDFQFPGNDLEYRRELEEYLDVNPPRALWDRLNDVDPRAASRIDARNGRRIARALEIIRVTGEPYSAALPEEPTSWRESIRIGFRSEPVGLARRLDERVHHMWEHGFVAEVEGLLRIGLREGKTASRAIGYAQAAAQIDGVIDEETAIEQTQALTRKYARRQRSWWNRDKRILWLDGDDPTAHRQVPVSVVERFAGR